MRSCMCTYWYCRIETLLRFCWLVAKSASDDKMLELTISRLSADKKQLLWKSSGLACSLYEPPCPISVCRVVPRAPTRKWS